jgi:hypothetical protein
MILSKDSAIEAAKSDLAKRLGVSESEIDVASVTDKDFPDMSLGAPIDDEMSAQMISGGWLIELEGPDGVYEYRADRNQLRLRGFQGSNYVVKG